MANELPLLNPLLQSNLDSDGFSINNLGGLTMTAGFATLFQNPTDPMHAATKDYADSIGGTALPDDTHAVYVSKVGNDADSGLNAGEPKLTIGSAVTAASTLLGLGALGVKVVVIDGGAYTENVSLPDLVVLEAAGAVLIGTLALASRSSAYLDRHFASADNQDLVSKTGGSGHGFYHCNILDQRGIAGTLTGGRGLVNSSTGSILFAMVGVLFVAASGEGVRDNGAGNGHIHFWTPDLYLAGNNAIGIRAQTPNSNFIGYIDHILKFGTPTGTVGISVTNAGASVRATITELIADTAYNITAGALYLQSVNVVGTRTGTPVWEWHNQAILPVAKGGMLAGGTIGQVLTKASGADFDLVWAAGGGGGPTAGRGIVVAGTDVHFAQNADYTANQIPFATSTTAIGFNANLYFEPATPALVSLSKVVVGQANTSADIGLRTDWTTTAASGSLRGGFFNLQLNPASASSATVRGLELLCRNLAGNNQNQALMQGIFAQASYSGTGTVTEANGILARAFLDGGGTMTTAVGAVGSLLINNAGASIAIGTGVLATTERVNGTLTTAYGFRHTHSGNAGTVYGLHLGILSGTVPNRWGIYQEDEPSTNYIGGMTHFGSATTLPVNHFVQITKTYDPAAAAARVFRVLATVDASANTVNTAELIGAVGFTAGTFSYTSPDFFRALSCAFFHQGSGTVTFLQAVRGDAAIGSGGGNVTKAAGVTGRVRSEGTGTMASGSALYARTPSVTGGPLTNAYGLYIEPMAGTNKWGIYQQGAADTNFLAGPLVIGSGAPSLGSSIVTRRTISADTGWGAAFVNSAARTTNGTLSCIGSYTVVNTTGLTANITGEHTALIGLCAHYINPGHATATRTVNLMQGLVIRSQHATGAGALTTMIGLDIRPEFAAAAGTTTAYQILLRERTGTNVTNYWGIYQEDVAARNYFAGVTMVGALAPPPENAIFNVEDVRTVTLPAANRLSRARLQVTGTGTQTSTLNAIYAVVRSDGTADWTTNFSVCIEGTYFHGGTGVVTHGRGVRGDVTNNSTGTLANASALSGILRGNAAGTFTTASLIRAETPDLSGGSAITTCYGLYIEPMAGTNKWGIYQEGASDSNYLAGRLGLGINTFPTMTGFGIAIGNITTAPSTNPATGGVLYSEAGALKWRGSGGTVTTIAPA